MTQIPLGQLLLSPARLDSNHPLTNGRAGAIRVRHCSGRSLHLVSLQFGRVNQESSKPRAMFCFELLFLSKARPCVERLRGAKHFYYVFGIEINTNFGKSGNDLCTLGFMHAGVIHCTAAMVF
ncbi:hypothetical protein BS78_09G262400 [Paspalum vaginatum]|nr:hypothetical protein BS78_09G262400 [Paspalum vaginatum]